VYHVNRVIVARISGGVRINGKRKQKREIIGKITSIESRVFANNTQLTSAKIEQGCEGGRNLIRL
jgi:phenylpyruvate tautomerase PptA (4-oxalocrotonate tautomerase family)